MKAFTGTFIKKDGTERLMHFCKLPDIAELFPGFLEARIGNNINERKVAPGMELVFDLDSDNFRYYNYSKSIGELVETEIPDDVFNS